MMIWMIWICIIEIERHVIVIHLLLHLVIIVDLIAVEDLDGEEV